MLLAEVETVQWAGQVGVVEHPEYARRDRPQDDNRDTVAEPHPAAPVGLAYIVQESGTQQVGIGDPLCPQQLIDSQMVHPVVRSEAREQRPLALVPQQVAQPRVDSFVLPRHDGVDELVYAMEPAVKPPHHARLRLPGCHAHRIVFPTIASASRL